MVVKQVGEYKVVQDLSRSIVSLSMPKEEIRYGLNQGERPLLPALPRLTAFASGSMLAQKAKQFDDGLYAAVDLAAQNGIGNFRGKAALLRSLSSRISTAVARGKDGPAETLFAAAHLGGLNIPPPATLEAGARDAMAEFLECERSSKPLGFYNWNVELTRIFQQDRLLQKDWTDRIGIEEVARALHASSQDRAAYEGYLQLVSQLTNPFTVTEPDLRAIFKGLDNGQADLSLPAYRFFPPSTSPETSLLKRLFPEDAPIPEGFNLMEEVIRHVRDSSLSLIPCQVSGWYDYQTWALEPLVVPDRMPENGKLNMDDQYLKHLEEMFKGIYALTRETHVKQLEIPTMARMCGGGGYRAETPTIILRPELTVEPLYSSYLRRAIGYRYIRLVLEEHFGKDALKTMHRQTADGPSRASLDDELREVSSLFYGAFVTVGAEVGIPKGTHRVQDFVRVCRYVSLNPEDEDVLGSGRGPAADAAAFRAWTQKGNDPDLSQDARMMVPVFYDERRGKLKVWVFLGWSEREMTVSFARPPEVKVFDMNGQDRTKSVKIEFSFQRSRVAVPEFAEVYVSKLLNRNEFRCVCDRYKTREKILQVL